jgi:hypothetical protein
MKKLIVLLVALLCLIALTGCQKNAIQGTWTDEHGIKYTFNGDNTFTIDTGNDVVVGGTFTITQGSDLVVFTINTPQGQPVISQSTYVLDNKAKTLTFHGSDGSTTLLHQ